MAEPSVPIYLARILSGNGGPIGTAFQVSDGVYVTAKHVLREAALLGNSDSVAIDSLGAPDIPPSSVEILGESQLSDLSVVRSDLTLSACVTNIQRSASISLNAAVGICGHADLPERPGKPRPRYFRANGTWRGVLLRDDSTTIGALTSAEVLKGMSGAPVCDQNGRVIGVVSGRYNSIDGWATGTVWATTTEDLVALLKDYIDLPKRNFMTQADFAAAIAGPAAITAAITLAELREKSASIDAGLGAAADYSDTTGVAISEEPGEGPISTVGRWLWNIIDDIIS